DRAPVDGNRGAGRGDREGQGAERRDERRALEAQSAAQKMRRTGRLRRGDAELYYEVVGQGPAVVFAHGLGGNHLSWWQQLAHFAGTHTCVAFAHRGFPPSSAVPGNRAPDAYADDLGALIDELQLDDVALVGQSMGGWTCLEYALRESKKVRALVMASTSG